MNKIFNISIATIICFSDKDTENRKKKELDGDLKRVGG
jgi:hypothetical protein